MGESRTMPAPRHANRSCPMFCYQLCQLVRNTSRLAGAFVISQLTNHRLVALRDGFDQKRSHRGGAWRSAGRGEAGGTGCKESEVFK